jgi:hypothetical protein
MFANSTYLQLHDGVFEDEDCNQIWSTRLALLTLEGLQPWMRIIVLIMSMC